MVQDNPLPKLRDLRKEIERCRDLMRERDALIQESADSYPQRRIAEAAGVSKRRIQQISGQ